MAKADTGVETLEVDLLKLEILEPPELLEVDSLVLEPELEPLVLEPRVLEPELEPLEALELQESVQSATPHPLAIPASPLALTDSLAPKAPDHPRPRIPPELAALSKKKDSWLRLSTPLRKRSHERGSVFTKTL